MTLSSSPTSIFAYDKSYDAAPATTSSNIDGCASPLTLQQFIRELPPVLHRQNEIKSQKSLKERMQFDAQRGTPDDPINQLFSRLDLALNEYKKYASQKKIK